MTLQEALQQSAVPIARRHVGWNFQTATPCGMVMFADVNGGVLQTAMGWQPFPLSVAITFIDWMPLEPVAVASEALLHNV